MWAIIKRILCVTLTVLLGGPIMEAQPKKGDPSPAPVPMQIRTTRKAFISNLGAQFNARQLGGAIGRGNYNVAPNRHYDLFYAAIKNWGRYDLTVTPTEADLVLEISFAQPIVRDDVLQGSGGSSDDPQFKLSILDAKTHFVLWTLIEHVEFASLPGNRVKNFDQGIADLVQEFKDLVAEQTP